MGLLKSYLAVKLKFKKPLHTKERWEEGILYYMILAYQAISFFSYFFNVILHSTVIMDLL